MSNASRHLLALALALLLLGTNARQLFKVGQGMMWAARDSPVPCRSPPPPRRFAAAANARPTPATLQGKPLRGRATDGARKLLDTEDGYCDPEFYYTDPDCDGGAVPAAACARGAGMAAASGYRGYCMRDGGCMAIQVPVGKAHGGQGASRAQQFTAKRRRPSGRGPGAALRVHQQRWFIQPLLGPHCLPLPHSLQLGQLDAECPGMWMTPPTCSPACYATLGAISSACRQELLSWENGLNTVQIQYGQPAYWLW